MESKKIAYRLLDIGESICVHAVYVVFDALNKIYDALSSALRSFCYKIALSQELRREEYHRYTSPKEQFCMWLMSGLAIVLVFAVLYCIMLFGTRTGV